MIPLSPRRLAALVLLGVFTAAVGAAEPKPLEFHVTFDKTITDKPFTGRVYVILTRNNALPSGPNWFAPEPCFAKDVKDWMPGTPLVIGADAIAHPVPLKDVKPGKYNVIAVMDFDRGISFTRSEGNGYSQPLSQELKPAETGPIALKIDQVVKEPSFPEKERVKFVAIESKLLSDFHKRPIKLRAGVILPKSFATNPERQYPIVYEIPGFGGNHSMALYSSPDRRTEMDGVEFLYVVLDPNCRTGHHVFADSANNGPCGQALIEELIPAIEKKHRAIGKPGTRFVTGHSSGGWSSLWLQVTYPDFFGGVWSTAPDPVDFRDFQRIDVYKPGTNMFTDAEGKPRPIARNGDKPILFYKPFSDMEEVMGHGGQLASFEAVFSPRGADGQPRKLWDRKTGGIDPEVAKAWEKYDIRLVVERNWKTLGPKLAGKVHVYMGDLDTFYLEGATRLLQKSLKDLGSDAMVELFPGKNHGSLMDAKLRERIAKEMAEQFRKSQK